ncbi:MAG: M20/M25/M40 family metallo-hydrolase [Lachnospiraceae bacterium]|nr:M20/M25/M40 family metallo-hydrolase [Lachnospiraceae bacterium]
MDHAALKKLWEEREDAFLKLLRIPSCYDAATVSEEMPYGAPVAEAFRYMKEICAEAGFAIREYDHRVFFASYGTGPRIDIASHLDVVEPGGGWTHDPFGAVKENGRIYGRGAQDMKSGAWASFLALKAFMDSGITPRREFRLVYGTDEERTMEDMRCYVRHAGLPVFAFSPDCEFPLYLGEKGAIMWTLSGKYSGEIRSLDAGVQCNVISPSAKAVLRDGTELSFAGRAAHASRPEEGENATVKLLAALCDRLPEDALIARLYAFFADPYGERAGIANRHPVMGKLTMNLGILKITEDGRLTAQIDVRYPADVRSEEIFRVFKEAFPELSPAMPYDDPPTLTDAEDPHIGALMQAYRGVTGEACDLRVSGGVSYAKVLGNCVTFGPVPDNAAKLAHQRDESIAVEDCIRALEIYYESIVRMNALEGE